MTSVFPNSDLTQPASGPTWRTVLAELGDYLDALTSNNAEAFELSRSSKARQLLQKLEQQHAQYRFEVSTFLGVPQDILAQNTPSQAGLNPFNLQHSWSNVRDTFIDQRAEPDMIRECLRGELITLSYFDKALGGDLPVRARALVSRQRQGIAAAVERLSQWTP